MKSIVRFLSNPKSIYPIIIIGMLLRIFFVFVGGKIYFGSSHFFIQADTSSWFNAFINLWEKGTYTVDLSNETASFFRPPGYSFEFGIFYLISFKNIELASHMLVVAQMIMDITCIWLIYKIASNVVRNQNEERRKIFCNTSALLFAIYPFSIVWAPVLYAEASSVFFLLLAVLYGTKQGSSKNIFLCGFFGGIAVLIRLQCAFCIPFIMLSLFFSNDVLKKKLKRVVVFGFALCLSYGLWPARNIILHHRVLFSQDLNRGYHWSRDFMSFLDFIYAVRTDHTPVYWQIIKNEKVDWPKEAYLDPGDSVLLDSAVALCRTCGTGFSYWKMSEGLQGKAVEPSQNCDSAIDNIFTSLYIKQKKKNAFNYWVTVPLGNLEKCFFKFNLYSNKSYVVKKFSSSLFLFRTFLILLGLAGIYLALRKKFLKNSFLFLLFSYTIGWYFFLSFFYRNMEIRYLLQCDVLLLIPASYVITLLISSIASSTEKSVNEVVHS